MKRISFDFTVGLNFLSTCGDIWYNHRRYAYDLRRSIQLATSISSAGLPSTPIVYVRFSPHFYTVDRTLFDTRGSRARTRSSGPYSRTCKAWSLFSASIWSMSTTTGTHPSPGWDRGSDWSLFQVESWTSPIQTTTISCYSRDCIKGVYEIKVSLYFYASMC